VSAISVEARLDRLPVTRLHRKVFNLVAVGMFFEGFDIYIAATVDIARCVMSDCATNCFMYSAKALPASKVLVCARPPSRSMACGAPACSGRLPLPPQ